MSSFDVRVGDLRCYRYHTVVSFPDLSFVLDVDHERKIVTLFFVNEGIVYESPIAFVEENDELLARLR